MMHILFTDLTSPNGKILYMHMIVSKDWLIYTDNGHLNNNATVSGTKRLQIYLFNWYVYLYFRPY